MIPDPTSIVIVIGIISCAVILVAWILTVEARAKREHAERMAELKTRREALEKRIAAEREEWRSML